MVDFVIEVIKRLEKIYSDFLIIKMYYLKAINFMMSGDNWNASRLTKIFVKLFKFYSKFSKKHIKC